MTKEYFIYILASKRSGTLYIGMTDNLANRISQHKNGRGSYFTNRYKVHSLVYCETNTSLEEARKRERNMKAWKRAWKIGLIEQDNPDWNDLSITLRV